LADGFLNKALNTFLKPVLIFVSRN